MSWTPNDVCKNLWNEHNRWKSFIYSFYFICNIYILSVCMCARVCVCNTSFCQSSADRCSKWILRGSLNAVSTLGHKLQGNLNVNQHYYDWKLHLHCHCYSLHCRYNQVSTALQSLWGKFDISVKPKIRLKYFHLTHSYLSWSESTSQKLEYVLQHLVCLLWSLQVPSRSVLWYACVLHNWLKNEPKITLQGLHWTYLTRKKKKITKLKYRWVTN